MRAQHLRSVWGKFTREIWRAEESESLLRLRRNSEKIGAGRRVVLDDYWIEAIFGSGEVWITPSLTTVRSWETVA